MKVIAVLAVWLLVALGAVAAIIIFPISWWMGEDDSYPKNILRALDKTSAAFLGRSGRYTVSAECGAAAGGAWALLRRAVDWLLGAGHCVEAARREGLV